MAPKHTIKSTQKSQKWRYGEGGGEGNEHFPLFYQHFIFKITNVLPFFHSTLPILPYNIHLFRIFTKK